MRIDVGMMLHSNVPIEEMTDRWETGNSDG